MSTFLHTALSRHARRTPNTAAFVSRSTNLSYHELLDVVNRLAAELVASGARTVALLADNGLSWALTDLAAMAAGLRMVPLPSFFSLQQMQHALRDARVDTLLVDPRLPLPQALRVAQRRMLATLPAGVDALALLRLDIDREAADTLPPGTQKITYTSGTTGEPRGVCLRVTDMARVAESLCVASEAAPGDQHLCVLPLPTLLENIGGLYAPLLMGATACLWSLADVGLRGASQLDVMRLIAALRDARATSAILVPQILHALVVALESGAPKPTALRFVAVGGAPMAPRLLERAAAVGLPVYEGYGLSECASVVALNRPSARKVGSVGKPLPHLQLRFAADGEILVAGNAFAGYVGDAPRAHDAPVATGDIGHLDADGFLHLTGRKKNMFVTAYGRNVAPEWVERELCLMPAIAQAAVFGEARPFNTAVILPRGSEAEVEAAIQAVNAQLPDYARVSRWLRADAPFTPTNDQLTANGRLRRAPILAAYGARLDAFYNEVQTV
ncbi:MAG: AMP-binding protein [Panacagrimonas sp.]